MYKRQVWGLVVGIVVEVALNVDNGRALVTATARQVAERADQDVYKRQVYTGSGEAVDGLTAADCGETLLGVPCEVYERSAFIRQSSLTVDASAELERRIAALITTGEEGQSFSEDVYKRQPLPLSYDKPKLRFHA